MLADSTHKNTALTETEGPRPPRTPVKPIAPAKPHSGRSSSMPHRHMSTFFPPSPREEGAAGAGGPATTTPTLSPDVQLLMSTQPVKNTLTALLRYGKMLPSNKRETTLRKNNAPQELFVQALFHAFIPTETKALMVYDETTLLIGVDTTELILWSSAPDTVTALLCETLNAYIREITPDEAPRISPVCCKINDYDFGSRGKKRCPAITFDNGLFNSELFVKKLKAGVDHFQQSHRSRYEELQYEQGTRMLKTDALLTTIRELQQNLVSHYRRVRVDIATLMESTPPIDTTDFFFAGALVQHLTEVHIKIKTHQHNLVATDETTAYFRTALTALITPRTRFYTPSSAPRAATEKTFITDIIVELTDMQALLNEQLDIDTKHKALPLSKPSSASPRRPPRGEVTPPNPHHPRRTLSFSQ